MENHENVSTDVGDIQDTETATAHNGNGSDIRQVLKSLTERYGWDNVSKAIGRSKAAISGYTRGLQPIPPKIEERIRELSSQNMVAVHAAEGVSREMRLSVLDQQLSKELQELRGKVDHLMTGYFQLKEQVAAIAPGGQGHIVPEGGLQQGMAELRNVLDTFNQRIDSYDQSLQTLQNDLKLQSKRTHGISANVAELDYLRRSMTDSGKWVRYGVSTIVVALIAALVLGVMQDTQVALRIAVGAIAMLGVSVSSLYVWKLLFKHNS